MLSISSLNDPFFSEQLTDRGVSTATSEITIDLSCIDYSIEETPDGQHIIEASTMMSTGESATPQLPKRTLRVALPPDANMDTVTLAIAGSAEKTINGTFDIAPAPLAATQEGSKIVYNIDPSTLNNGRSMDVYGQDELFDEQFCTLVNVQEMGRWKIAEFEYSPFAYNPVTGELRVVEDAQVTVSFKRDAAPDDALVVSTQWDASAKDLVANFDQAAEWYASYAETASRGTLMEGVQASLVIITTQEIVDNAQKLNDFIATKEDMGHTVLVVTESDWHQYKGGDKADAIRNWLQVNYASMGIENVLLIGNPDPTDGDVPMKMTWPRHGSRDAYEQSPTDYYYSDLTSDWDYDGDGWYGEWAEDIPTQPLHEVIVGRIPVYNEDYASLDSILQKTIAYTYDTDISWRESMILPMAVSNYPEEGSGFFNSTKKGVYGDQLAEAIIEDYADDWNFDTYTLYEKAGLAPVTNPSDAPLTRANLINQWSSDPTGIVSWWGHGSETGTYRKHWDVDWDGDGVADDDGWEIDWEPFITAPDTSSLDDAHPSVVVQISCLNGTPEITNNLGYSLLKNGAIGTYSASRVSWYAVTPWETGLMALGDNASYGYLIPERLVTNQYTETLGHALQWTKETLGMGFGGASWMNMTDFNLYGDPTVVYGYQHVTTPGEGVLQDNLTTESALWNLDELWQYGQPTGEGGDYGHPDPVSGSTGPNVIGVELNGDYPRYMESPQYATLGPIDASNFEGMTLTFRRYLNVGPGEDNATIEVSSDGQNWQSLWTNGDAVNDPFWRTVSLALPALADRQESLYVRWGIGPTDGVYQASGWNLDDVSISGTRTTASIQGDVWFDATDDGVWDADEPGVGGWLAYVDMDSNGVFDPGEPSAMTDFDGHYQIDGLTAGEQYAVRLEMQAGWHRTSPAADHHIVTASGATALSADFGVSRPVVEINGTVWQDLNADGLRQPGEGPLAGALLYVDENGNGQFDALAEASSMSNDAGAYRLFLIAEGDYSIGMIPPIGWEQTVPTPGALLDVSTSFSQVADNVDFAAEPVFATVYGQVFDDANTNGVQDAGESLLAGQQVYLDLNGNGSLDSNEPSLATGANGRFEFFGLDAGMYEVRWNARSDWEQTSPTQNGALQIAVNLGQRGDAGAIGVATLRGTLAGEVWDDADVDGARDIQESPAAGWQVYIDANDNGVWDLGEWTAVSDQQGQFEFDGLLPGDYRVRIVPQDQWAVTGPAGAYLDATVVSRQTTDAGDFMVASVLGSVSGKVWDDADADGTVDTGEAPLSDWTVYLDTNSNGQLDAGELSTLTGPGGEYSFDGLAPGDYNVVIDMLTDWVATSPVSADHAVSLADHERVSGLDFGVNLPVLRDWTFLVYIDGDCNLEDAAIGDFLEMAQIGSTSEVAIVVQMDRTAGYDSRYGNWTGTRRGLVHAGDAPNSTWGTSIGEVNMGSASTLIDFVNWGTSTYEAENYAVVLWDHGGGISGVCWDDTSGDNLTLDELGYISTQIPEVDLFGFDACLMGMGEVAYEIADVADVMVASEENEPWEGWEYDTFLDDLVADPGMTAAELGEAIIDSYGAFYGLGGAGYQDGTQTLSSMDLTMMRQDGPFAQAIDSFVNAMLTETNQADWDAIMRVAASAQRYGDPTYVDLADVMDSLVDATANTSAILAANSLANMIDDVVLYNYAGANTDSNGLSVYWPLSALSPIYNMAIDFVAETDWEDLLTASSRPRSDISGIVFNDANLSGQFDAGDSVVADTAVYMDLDGDAVYDSPVTANYAAMTGLPDLILDGRTTVSTIDVPDTGTILDVNVNLEITHGWVGDLIISLVAPDGTSTYLAYMNGGDGDNYIGSTFDDEAGISINLGTAPFTGAFQPVQPLSAFDGLDPQGQWSLRVFDAFFGDQGALVSWSLDIETGDMTTTTDASGRYTFGNVAAGEYEIGVAPDTWFVQTAPGAATHHVEINGTQSVLDADFGIVNGLTEGVGTVAGTVWMDVNNNHVADPGERGFENVQFFVDDVLQPVTSNENGDYLLAMTPGIHTIRILPDGPSAIYGSNEQTVFVAAGSAQTDVDFFVVPSLGSITAQAMNNVTGEPLAGWSYFLDDNGNFRYDAGERQVTSDANGYFSFDNLVPGDYAVVQETPSQWNVLSPQNGIDFVSVGLGEDLLLSPFANWADPSTIAGQLFEDIDQDGVMDVTESALAGWTVYIDLNNSGDLNAGDLSTLTDVQGEYAFTGLQPGTYAVAIEMPTAWQQTTPAGNQPATVVLSAGDFLNDVHFGATIRSDSFIRGTVFRDASADGVLDAGENGVAGWTVYLDDNANGQFDLGERSVLTDVDGVYQFDGLPDGSYTVAIVDEAGWIATTATPVTDSVVAQQGLTGIDFGVSQTGTTAWTVLVLMDADDPASLMKAEAQFADLAAVGSRPNVNVVGVIDTATETRYGLIHAGDVFDSAWGTATTTPLDIGDPILLAPFVADMASAFPADDLALILVGTGDIIDGPVSDSQTGRTMRWQDSFFLGTQTPEASLFGFDLSGFMSTEVAMQFAGTIADDTDYLVGSEGLMPLEGWNYAGMLERLVANVGADAQTLAGYAVESFGEHYRANGSGQEVLSAVQLDSTKLDGLAGALHSFAEAAMELNLNDWTSLQRIAGDSWSSLDPMLDLSDYVQRVSEYGPAAMQDKATDILRALAALDIETYAGDLANIGGMAMSIELPSSWPTATIYAPPSLLAMWTAWENMISMPAPASSDIGGTVWHDIDGDGAIGAEEAMLPGTTVFIDLNGNSRFDQAPLMTAASLDGPQPISDFETIASRIEIGRLGSITDLNVTLDIAHTNLADLYITLTSPSGQTVELVSQSARGANLADITFDDEASQSLVQNAAPYAGSYRSFVPLSTFDGEEMAGSWELRVTDTGAGRTGVLNGWSLDIDSTEPYQVTDASGSYLFGNVAGGQYQLAQVLASGWQQTHPNTTVHNVTIVGTDSALDTNFGAEEGGIVVTTIADERDGDYSAGDLSLREALHIAAQTPGDDNILFASSLADQTIHLDPALGALAIDSNVVIDGLGAGHLTIDGGGASQIFVLNKPDVTADVRGMALRNGVGAGAGGAVLLFGGDLMLADVAIHSSSALFGGGVAALADGRLTLDNVDFINNRADNAGGALFVSGGATVDGMNVAMRDNFAFANGGAIAADANAVVIIHGGVISGANVQAKQQNSAAQGGALHAAGGARVTLGDMLVTGHAAQSGGAVYAVAQGTYVSLAGTHIEGSQATLGGGVLALSGAEVVLDDTAMADNSAAKSGGAVYVGGQDTLVRTGVEGTTLSDNAAGYFAGGVFATDGGKVDLSDSLISGSGQSNARLGGGAVAYDGGQVVLNNSIVTGNEADLGGGIYVAKGDASVEVNGTAGSIVNNSAVEGGGAMVMSGGSLTVKDATVKANQATASGGGIAVEGSDAKVTAVGAEIRDNQSASLGGGIYASGGAKVGLVNATVDGNRSAKNGGGLLAVDGTTVIAVTGSAFTNNEASRGGGVLISDASLVMSNTRVEANHAKAVGGGVAGIGAAEISIGSSQVRQNTALGNGGGLYMDGPGAEMSIVDSTILGNTGYIGGGVMAVGQSQVKLWNTAVTDNTAAERGGGIGVDTTASVSSDETSTIDSNRALQSALDDVAGALSATTRARATDELAERLVSSPEEDELALLDLIFAELGDDE